MTSDLNIYYQNVNGLCSKIKEYHLSILNEDYDILAFTESNLSDSIPSSQIFPHNYVVYRCDRNLNNSKKKSGGGVVLAVNRKLNSKIVQLHGYNNLEQICIEVQFESSALYVCCIYLPPKSLLGSYNDHIRFVDEISARMGETDSLVVLGDYNLSGISWVHDNDENFTYATNVSCAEESSVNDGMLAAGLFQINSVKNSNGKILDLVFTNNISCSDVSECTPLHQNETHHKSIKFSLRNIDNVKCENSYPVKSQYFDFSKADFNGIARDFESIDWDSALYLCSEELMAMYGHLIHENITEYFPNFVSFYASDSSSKIDLMTSNFYVLLYSIIIRNTPYKTKIDYSYPPWYDKDLINILKNKNSWHKKFKRNGYDSSWHRFCFYRSEFKRLNRILYNQYIEKVSSNIKNDPKSFFKFVNYQKETNGFPSCILVRTSHTTQWVSVICLEPSFLGSTVRVMTPKLHVLMVTILKM